MDSNAISVGYAIQSGVILQKCGNHWCRIGTSQVVNSSLANGTTANIVSLVENYKYNNCSSWLTQAKGLTKIANSCTVAGNGLFYDSCNGGKMKLHKANTYCSSKGMRLPILTETSHYGSGVPSCGSWTWTSTDISKDGDVFNYYRIWNGTKIDGDMGHNSEFYVRCVR